MYTREQILDAFEKWNNGFRTDPTKYMTDEQMAAESDRSLAERQTDHLTSIMEDNQQ